MHGNEEALEIEHQRQRSTPNIETRLGWNVMVMENLESKEINESKVEYWIKIIKNIIIEDEDA